MTVRAIYENGVFRPTEPVNLPENAEVEVLCLRRRPKTANWTPFTASWVSRMPRASRMWRRDTTSISHEDGFS